MPAAGVRWGGCARGSAGSRRRSVRPGAARRGDRGPAHGYGPGRGRAAREGPEVHGEGPRGAEGAPACGAGAGGGAGSGCPGPRGGSVSGGEGSRAGRGAAGRDGTRGNLGFFPSFPYFRLCCAAPRPPAALFRVPFRPARATAHRHLALTSCCVAVVVDVRGLGLWAALGPWQAHLGLLASEMLCACT